MGLIIMSDDTLQKITSALADVIMPMEGVFSSPKTFSGFIEQLGWELPPGVDELELAIVNLDNFKDAIEEIINSTPEELEDTEVMAGRYMVLLAESLKAIINIKAVIETINTLSDITADYLNKTQIIDKLFVRLIDYLIIKYVERNSFISFAIMQFLGIFEIKEYEAVPENYQSRHLRYTIHYDRILSTLTQPDNVLTNVYQWNSEAIELERLILNLSLVLQAFGASVAMGKVRRKLEEQILERDVPEADTDPMPQLDISIIKGLGWDPLDVGINLFGLRHSVADNTDTGIGITPFASGEASMRIPVFKDWILEIKTSLDIEGGVALLLRPNEGLSTKFNLSGEGLGDIISQAEFILSIIYSPVDKNIDIFTINDIGGLSVESIKFGAGMGLVGSNEFDILIDGDISGGKFELKPGNGDGFISKILPPDGIKSEFEVGFTWSRIQGISFRGSGGIEITVPTHISIGPIELQSISLGVKIDETGIPVNIGVTLSAMLGPLQAVVENIGVKVNTAFKNDQSGNLGPVDLDAAFKPPNGVGLAIDAGTVKGGGYLYFDYDNERYAGALELYIEGLFALKAIGLITTRMPDGSKGFSLLIIITAEFGTPIQLGYGFTLSGVGGLLGLHRTMRLEPMLEGVRTGAINSVMFPEDLIANAPRIISDLRNFFPPYVGIFLIGPMAKLGWSTPNLITLSLGVIIEIPGNVAIVGILKAVLPHEEAAILKLQVNFLGAIEFDKKRAYLFAALYDSRVLFITLEGEMGVLIAWGNNPNLVLSVGGFHPSFDPPPLPFPTPKRIAISILNTSVAKVRVEGYFAITSNTAQFGAKAELFFGLSEFKIEGHLSFNALFRFSPFYFEISISVSLSVKVFGIGLFSVRFRGSLEGPTPWHIEGTGSISLLFFDISVDFSKTWGERKETTLPPITIMPLLKGEFEKLENWQAVVPAANNLLVSLREIEAGEDLVLHPVGTLKISQRAVPLQLKLDKLGTQKPADNNYFDIDISGDDFEVIGEVLEAHATAQTKNVSDKQKLSLPPYCDEKGGIELSVKGEQLKTSSAIKRVVRYEEIIIDNNFKRGVNRFVGLIATFFRLFVKNGAVGKSPLSNKVKKQQMPFADKIAVKANTFVVANNSDNTPLGGEVIEFASYLKAEQYMDEQIEDDPTLRDNVHVIPHAEMREAV
jgi:hypothetical protein